MTTEELAKAIYSDRPYVVECLDHWSGQRRVMWEDLDKFSDCKGVRSDFLRYAEAALRAMRCA